MGRSVQWLKFYLSGETGVMEIRLKLHKTLQ